MRSLNENRYVRISREYDNMMIIIIIFECNNNNKKTQKTYYKCLFISCIFLSLSLFRVACLSYCQIKRNAELSKFASGDCMFLWIKKSISFVFFCWGALSYSAKNELTRTNTHEKSGVYRNQAMKSPKMATLVLAPCCCCCQFFLFFFSSNQL